MKIIPEWIEWKGGDSPVAGDVAVIVAKRNGTVALGNGDWFLWSADNAHPHLVIAYCPLDIEPYKPKPTWTVFTTSLDDNTLQYKGVGKGGFYSTETAQRIADALNAAGVEI